MKKICKIGKIWYNGKVVFLKQLTNCILPKCRRVKGEINMTVEQEIAQKAAEVEERRKAREAGIRLATIRTVSLGILDLLDMTTTGIVVQVERVNVYDGNKDRVWFQVETKMGIYTEDSENFSPEIAEKICSLNKNSINEQEKRYLQKVLGKYRKVFKIENGFAVE